MTAQVNLVRKYRVTHTEAIMLMLMADGEVLSKDAIKERCLPSKFVCDQAVSTHAPVKVTNIRGVGYLLEGKHLEAVRAVIGGVQ
jgi:hypothetical protein